MSELSFPSEFHFMLPLYLSQGFIWEIFKKSPSAFLHIGFIGLLGLLGLLGLVKKSVGGWRSAPAYAKASAGRFFEG
jgi:hypothetical protein